jgi:hypothetical protein
VRADVLGLTGARALVGFSILVCAGLGFIGWADLFSDRLDW